MDWTKFEPFTLVHGAAALTCFVLMIGSCRLGVKWRGRVEESRLSAAWGGAAIVINLWSIVFWLLPANFDVMRSLPVQLCDVACLTAPFAFLTQWRWPRTLTYFWGFGLSTQAFITPTLQEGPANMTFWLFWLVHLVIVGSALYDVVVRRYRPTLRDLLVMVGISLVWLAAMLVINHATGANYGFVGNTKPEKPTIIDALGPWPGRVVLIAMIGIAVCTLLWAVWPLADRVRGGRNR